jgi:hypothetical protein
MLYYAVKDFPPDLSEPFRLEWLRSVQVDTIQKLETNNIFKQLDAEHIRWVSLKGYVLKNLYPSPEMRSMGDIDILIDAVNMPRVTEIMIKMGFTPEPNQGGGNHYSFNKKPLTHIEYHHSLIDISVPFSEFVNPGWQYVNARCPPDQPTNQGDASRAALNDCLTRPKGELNVREACLYQSNLPIYQSSNLPPVQPSNFPAYQLSREGCFIHMISHIAAHFLSGGAGIRSVMDVWVYNQHYEQQLDWTFINSEFKRAGLLQFAQNIKDLSDVWFGTKEPTELLDELGDYIIGSGTYGTSDKAVLSAVLKSDDKNAIGIRKIKAFTKRVFLPLKEMQYRYAFLKKLPVMLPVGWMLRGIRVLNTRKDILKSWVNNVSTVQADELEQHKQRFQRFGL